MSMMLARQWGQNRVGESDLDWVSSVELGCELDVEDGLGFD